jgi:NAD(P)-dependent dehydrogenase (short-subunit alcohol dehydrogenase family)
MDVTDEASIRSAAEQIENSLGDSGLDALINNAGIGAVGPLECTDRRTLQNVFDVNVFGLMSVTRAMIPQLRKAGGRIVNLSSVGGLITIPFGGALCASKHAVEALSEALRMELKPSGIEVIVIRPASIHSPAAGKLEAEKAKVLAAIPETLHSIYSGNVAKFYEEMVASENAGSPPDVVAEVIARALSDTHPMTHYLAGKNAHLLSFLGQWVPERLRESLILHKLGL